MIVFLVSGGVVSPLMRSCNSTGHTGGKTLKYAGHVTTDGNDFSRKSRMIYLCVYRGALKDQLFQSSNIVL